MKKTARTTMTIITMVITMIMGSAIVFAGTPAAETLDDDPSGRIVAARGELTALSGTLVWERDEWFLHTGTGSAYELHLGPYGHREEPVFTAGTPAETEGFVYRDHMAPISVDTDGETHRFWDTNRMPLWAGSGEGGGRVAQTNPEIPMGQRLAMQEDRDLGEGLQVGPRDFAGQGGGAGARAVPEDRIERGFRNEPAGAGRFRN